MSIIYPTQLNMHAYLPVYFKAFYSIESILEVTPKPEQMEDNEEKTGSQSIVTIFNTLLGMNSFSGCTLDREFIGYGKPFLH